MSTGGFTLDGTVGYPVYASIQNASVPTSATLETGQTGFAFGQPFEFDNWFGDDTLTFIRVIGLGMATGVGTVSFSGVITGVGDRDIEGMMLDMQHMMGS